MRRDLALTIRFDDGETQELSLVDIPYTFGRRGYCSFGTMKGSEVGAVHCRITEDPDTGEDPEVYSGLCVQHLAPKKITQVNDCELQRDEFVSLTWDEIHQIQIGDYSFEVVFEKPSKRQRSGSPPQPGSKASSRGKGRVRGPVSEDTYFSPTKRQRGRTR